ncbi:hypothetical protein CAL7716_059310 [Calothrix sp. PCC 7716]|nr:hypothetical protein CAL7716_059310 [Calothrix sp. PCC 7716]
MSTPTPKSHYLNQKHRAELTEKRGLSEKWCEVNCRSVTAQEASELLGYKAQSDGIWLEGANFQGQFKPNKPWKSEEDKKAPKYRSPSCEYDVMLPIHPEIQNYWTDLEALKQRCYVIDGHPLLVLSESLFRGIAGCSNDIPTIGLIGVENGLTPGAADPQGKRYLVPGLEKFARAGFGFIHAMDADSTTNNNVVMAQIKLAHQLKKFDIPQYSVTGLWSIDDGKGMDDYIQKNGADKFRREVLAKAISVEEWEKQFAPQEGTSDKKLSPRLCAQKLIENYRPSWKYDLERQTWRRWNARVWEACEDEVFVQTVYHSVEALKNPDYKNFGYVENVVKFLKYELLARKWVMFDRMEWIAFCDCVYEVKTGKTHKHTPDFGFISCLEHNFPLLIAVDSTTQLLEQLRINVPTFYSWAMHSQNGDPLKVLKLLAIVNGVIKFRFYDLQKFVHLCGVPGSGKGTFARLLESVVGKQNYASARLSKLGDDNVIGAVIDKQLVICPDEKKTMGDYISTLLNFTGDDNIPYRQIYKPQASGKFYGAIVVISNNPLFVGDVTGIDRRLCLVTFDKPLVERDSKVEARMQQEVAQLTALALAMDDTQVKDLINGAGEGFIPDFRRQSWLHKTENDTIALFMEEMLTSGSEDSFILVGNKNSGSETLYGAYVQFCENNNSKTLFTANNFRNHLLELCREIGWKVRETRQRNNEYRIYGVRLRLLEETAPRVSEVFMGIQEECVTVCNPTVNLKVLQNKECVKCVECVPLSSREKDSSPTDPSLQDSDDSGTQQTDLKKNYSDDPPQKATHSHNSDTERLTGFTHPPTSQLQLLHMMLAVWENIASLGELVLKAPEHELIATAKHCTPEQIAHIKKAALSVWRPGLNRDVDFCGERCEVWAAGQGRDVDIKTPSGARLLVKLGSLRPWLGI